MGAKTTFICPYCFEKRKISEVQFRCTNRRCPEVDDIPMTRYENGNLEMPMKGHVTFTPPNKKAFSPTASGICPSCGSKTHKWVCPACHNTLPESTLVGKDMIISIVGSRSTGKSHFVGVIIKELRDRIAVAFDGSLEGFDDSFSRWQENFGKNLYDNNVKLEQTQSSMTNTNNGAYRPLIFKLKIKHKHKSLFGGDLDTFTFVFFDTAGEDLNDEDTMSTVNKYICKSAGIIFLLDPMQIPAAVSQLNETDVKRAGAVNIAQDAQADNIITRVSNLIRHDRNLSESAVIDIPVAAVFSKFDVIEPIVPQGSAVLTPSPHCTERYFDLADWHNVNEEISALLQEWNEEAFPSQLKTNYKTYSYFAVSALGLHNNPEADGKIQRPRPHRIEDPLLWLLMENGVIKGKK